MMMMMMMALQTPPPPPPPNHRKFQSLVCGEYGYGTGTAYLIAYHFFGSCHIHITIETVLQIIAYLVLHLNDYFLFENCFVLVGFNSRIYFLIDQADSFSYVIKSIFSAVVCLIRLLW